MNCPSSNSMAACLGVSVVLLCFSHNQLTLFIFYFNVYTSPPPYEWWLCVDVLIIPNHMISQLFRTVSPLYQQTGDTNQYSNSNPWIWPSWKWISWKSTVLPTTTKHHCCVSQLHNDDLRHTGWGGSKWAEKKWGEALLSVILHLPPTNHHSLTHLALLLLSLNSSGVMIELWLRHVDIIGLHGVVLLSKRIPLYPFLCQKGREG